MRLNKIVSLGSPFLVNEYDLFSKTSQDFDMIEIKSMWTNIFRDSEFILQRIDAVMFDVSEQQQRILK